MVMVIYLILKFKLHPSDCDNMNFITLLITNTTSYIALYQVDLSARVTNVH